MAKNCRSEPTRSMISRLRLEMQIARLPKGHAIVGFKQKHRNAETGQAQSRGVAYRAAADHHHAVALRILTIDQGRVAGFIHCSSERIGRN